MKWGLALGWLPLLAAQAAFVAPQEGEAPFRRDRLPIDGATLRDLSKECVQQAESAGNAPADQRRAAQWLAMALALDPANRSARDLLARLSSQDEVEPATLHPMARTAQLAVNWLAQPEAGEDAARFTRCLEDLSGANETENGAWQGWVAPLEEFIGPEEPPPGQPEEAGEKNAPEAISFSVRSDSIRVPYRENETASGSARVIPTEFTLTAYREKGDEPGADWRIEPPDHFSDKSRSLQLQVKKRISGRPKPAKLTRLKFDLPRWSKKTVAEPAQFNAAAELLVEGVYRGVELDPEVLFLATVGSDGKLGLPPLFWETLRTLEPDEGRRLILPSGAEDLLPSMITLDRSEFFLEHQVLLADTLDQALQWASLEPLPEVAEAGQLFDEVRKAKGTRSLGSFLAMPGPRQRLARIAEILPEHASARMLVLRGTSQWPRRLPREMYAREIRSALLPLGPVLLQAAGAESVDPSMLLEADSQCRQRLAPVENLSERVDARDELHNLAFNVSKSLGNLAGQIRRLDRDYQTSTHRIQLLVTPVYRDFREAVMRLTDAVGDASTFPAPRKP
ncbi:hypothetical protein Hsar01_01842 [Haloferula sargassicola]|uniref:Uncharacterized protein n=2 Tax=Haloferula sargassicola TaxID=490096 RepID=A0ABP9UMS5_9BACT